MTKDKVILPYNPITSTEYKGLNISILMESSTCPQWATFLQWKKEGYTIKKGSKGTKIRTFVDVDVTKNKKTGETETGKAPRWYTLFNREQVKKAEE